MGEFFKVLLKGQYGQDHGHNNELAKKERKMKHKIEFTIKKQRNTVNIKQVTMTC